MARPLRIEAAGMWYHIMNRGVIRKEIFKSDEDYLKFLDILIDNCEKFNVEIHSYVLMPNHFHFFLKTNEANLSRFMHDQLTSYTTWFNFKYERVGHFFQGRYKSIIIDTDNYGTEITRYIHLNPVRTKKNSKLSLKEKRKLLKNYKWSSYPAMVRLKPAYPFLFIHETLESFGDNYKEQIETYINFVEEGIKKDLESPFKKTVSQLVLGQEAFVRKVQVMLKNNIKNRRKHNVEPQNTIRKSISLPIEKIFDTVCKEYDVDIQLILKNGKGNRSVEPRRITFYLAAKYCAGLMTLNEIGKVMGCKSGSSVTMAIKRINQSIKNDTKLKNRLKRLEDKLK